eukprot:936948-Rhodomonas_salina.2
MRSALVHAFSASFRLPILSKARPVQGTSADSAQGLITGRSLCILDTRLVQLHRTVCCRAIADEQRAGQACQKVDTASPCPCNVKVNSHHTRHKTQQQA